jgi:hypothetical protein
MDATDVGVIMTNIITSGLSEDIIKILEGQGMPVLRSLDMDIPSFPRDITMVDDQELMILASKYMENYNFMRTQVACAEISELEVQNQYDIAEAKALLSKTSGKSTEKSTMLKAAVLTDDELIQLGKDKMYATAYKKLLHTALENLERNYQLTSRELTRRTSALRARF